MRIVLHNHKIIWPPPKEPSWASRVERWYQLDAAAYSIAETFSILQDKISKKPSLLILASPLGSMETDFQFVRGNYSPSKFVHTLPNIRSTSLLQLMGWQGPVLCFQNDPFTWLTALIEAIDLIGPNHQEIWVIQFKKTNVQGNYEVSWAQVLNDFDEGKISQAFLIVSYLKGENVKKYNALKDQDFWEWISKSHCSRPFLISKEWSLSKNE